MTRITATAEVSAIGQIEPNSSNREAASSLTMLTVAKFVRTSVATAADTIGGPILREYLNDISPERGGNTTPPVNKLLSVTFGGILTLCVRTASRNRDCKARLRLFFFNCASRESTRQGGERR